MRVVIQRVTKASVTIDSRTKASIGCGLLILAGFEENDTKEDLEWTAGKISRLRLFDDDTGVMNLSVNDINGQLLIISQFTLHARTKKGNRPSYTDAAHPTISVPLYNKFLGLLESLMPERVRSGEFGAYMHVELVNDGPVTIFVDSKKRE